MFLRKGIHISVGKMLSNAGRLVGAAFLLYAHYIGFHPSYSVSCGNRETVTANCRVKVAVPLVVSLRTVSA
jgi:hypothetical protein